MDIKNIPFFHKKTPDTDFKNTPKYQVYVANQDVELLKKNLREGNYNQATYMANEAENDIKRAHMPGAETENDQYVQDRAALFEARNNHDYQSEAHTLMEVAERVRGIVTEYAKENGVDPNFGK